MNSCHVITDLDADYYVQNSVLQNSLAKTLLDKYSIVPHTSILDVGCGDGRITAELARRASQVIGLDPSSSMIQFASTHFPKTKFPNLAFHLGMAEDVTYVEKFDLIVSFSCFHWLKDPKKAIRQLSAALKEGGEILILTYPKESPYYCYLQTALNNYPDYSTTNPMLSAHEYKTSFIDNKLEIQDFDQKHLLATYNNSEEIKQYIKGWLHSYVSLPEQLHDPFLDHVCTAVTNDPTNHTNRQISIPYIALVIKARKR